MAKTLKNTGLAAQIAWILAVDDDSAIKGWKTPGAVADWSVGAGLTLGGGGSAPSVVSGTWQGVTKDLISFPSAGDITIDTAVSVDTPYCLFIITRNSNVTWSSVNRKIMGAASTATGAYNSAQPVLTTVNGPTVQLQQSEGSYYLSRLIRTFGAAENYSAFFCALNAAAGDSPTYYGVDGGAITAVSYLGTNGNATTQTGVFWRFISPESGFDGDVVAIGCLRQGLSVAEADSIHQDPIGLLFDSAASPVLTSPTGTATGNTTGSGTVSTDTASGTLWSKATTNATETDPGAGNEASSGWTSTTVSGSGAQSVTFTGLTTNVAVYPHYIHVNSGARSAVSNGASTFTPSTLATTGSPSAQSGSASASLAWSGSNPSALVTGGIGTKTWTLVDADSSGLSGIDGSTGVPSGTLTGTPGTYAPVIRCTDSSTAGTNPSGGGSPPQTVDFTLSLTVSSGPTGPTIGTQPTNQTARIGATATFTVAATTSGGALSYQWKFDGSNVGTDSATYARSGVVLGDHGGSVTCDVTDTNGTTVSSAATLTVAVTFSGTVPAQVANTGAAFSLDLSSYFAGGLSRTYSVLSGSLPTGITQVGTTAVFSGTLGTPGSGTFVVRSTDSATNTDQTNSISWTINAAVAGTITTDIFRNWANGSPYASGYVIDRVVVERISDGLDVLTLTSQALNGSSRLVITNAALAVGGDYMIRTRNTLGTLRGYKKYTAT